MTGLEKIIGQIAEDAKLEADSLLESARQQAGEILAAAEKEAEAQAQALLDAAGREAQDIHARAESAAQLKKRNDMLSFKQELIRETITQAQTQLETAPDGPYFDTLAALFKRFGGSGKGEVRFNQRDLDRLPKDFAEKLGVKVSPTPCDIDSGFLLTDGGVDVNCSFGAVFEEADSALRDLCGQLLFAAN